MKALAARVIHYFDERKMLLCLVLAISLVLLMTAASLRAYYLSDVSHLDLSRPGHEKSRSDVMTPGNETRFEAAGPVDATALKTFQQLYDKKRTALNALGRFDGNALGDDQMKLTTNE